MLSSEAAIQAALVVDLLAIAATLAFRNRAHWCRWLAFGGSAAASALTLVTAAGVLARGEPVAGVLFAHHASGLVVSFVVTPLSAWFLLVMSTLGIPIAIFSVGYLAHAVPPSRIAAVGIAFNILMAAVTAVFVVDNIIGFLFAWELMTLATATLVAIEYESPESRRAAYLYLIMSHLGTGALVAGFFTLVSLSGSVSLSASLTEQVVAGANRDYLFWLFLVGFGVKAGMIPLHVWLPEAHPAAPGNISALMSAVLITAGVYGIFRVCAFGLGTPETQWGLAVMGLGTVSAILGVLYALAQSDLKRLLAYSTIENAGIILLGLGAGMTLLSVHRSELAVVAVCASLLHVLNHATFKGLLFLGAGSVVSATGTRRIEELGGVLKRMPLTGLCFLIGAMAISGLPPLNGFVSEWLTFQSLLLGFQFVPGLTRVNFPLAGALLALTSALAAVCFVKAFGISFLALPRSRAAATAHESPATMVIPMALLALACLALGLFPGAVLSTLEHVTASLPGLPRSSGLVRTATTIAVGAGPFAAVTPVALGLTVLAGVAVATGVVMVTRIAGAIRRSPTWGCGGVLSSQSEYTGTAFSKPLLMVFREIYRPTREVESLAEVSPYFPQEVRYREAIEPTFERLLYRPLARNVIRIAERLKVLQAGSLHAYLGYVLVLGVVLLIWLGGR